MHGCRALRVSGKRDDAFKSSHLSLARHLLPFMEMVVLEENSFVRVQCVERTLKERNKEGNSDLVWK